MIKYPRTRHLEGSGLQADDDPNVVPWSVLAGQRLVVEEKMDGANCGISFEDAGVLRLQSRGHYLQGGPRERQFELLKSWASAHAATLYDLLGTRYILYAEWMYAKHSVFYTALPHYLLEFDIYDRERDLFLSSPRRHALLDGSPVVSVHVLHTGTLPNEGALHRLIGPSRFIGPDAHQQLGAVAMSAGLDAATVLRETDRSGLMEGLYVKVEDDEQVLARYKLVRPGFSQTLLDSGNHWMERPLLPNQLREGVSLW